MLLRKELIVPKTLKRAFSDFEEQIPDGFAKSLRELRVAVATNLQAELLRARRETSIMRSEMARELIDRQANAARVADRQRFFLEKKMHSKTTITSFALAVGAANSVEQALASICPTLEKLHEQGAATLFRPVRMRMVRARVCRPVHARGSEAQLVPDAFSPHTLYSLPTTHTPEARSCRRVRRTVWWRRGASTRRASRAKRPIIQTLVMKGTHADADADADAGADAGAGAGAVCPCQS